MEGKMSSIFLAFRSIREKIRKETGIEAYCAKEVFWIVENLSVRNKKVSYGTVCFHLRKTGSVIKPHQKGIDSKSMHTIAFYPREIIWKYLKKLEGRGKIRLKEEGINDFSTIIIRRLHEGSLIKNPYIIGGRIKKGNPIDSCGREGEPPPSWDGTVKQIEQ
jgi:hypothetical protein